jgi:class 3 adenylate cyclase
VGSEAEQNAHPRTFLIADLRGYTRYTKEQGDEAASRLAAGFAGLVRETVPLFGGELVELAGDQALSVFGSARQALRASVELQRRLRAATGDEPAFPLGVGMGLDAGEAVPTEGGFRGGALNLAARLCAIAAPGQVLASDGVVHLAQRVEGLQFVSLRAVRLKGYEQPVRYVEVIPDDPLPPLPAPPSPPTPGSRRQLGSAAAPPFERRRFPMLVLAVAAGLATALAIAALAARGGGGAAGPPLYHVHLARLDLSSGQIVGSPVGIPGSGGGSLAVGKARLFLADSLGVVSFDPRSGATTVRHIEGGAYFVAVDGGRVWLSAPDRTGSADGLVYGYDELALASPIIAHVRSGLLTQGKVGGRTRAAPLAIAAGAVWMPTFQGVLHFDEHNPTAVRLIHSQLGGHFVIAARASDVWTQSTAPGEVNHIDAIHRRSQPPIRFHTTAPITGLAVAQGALWVAVESSADTATPNLFEINAGSGRTFEHIRVPGYIKWLAGSRSTLLIGYYPDNGSGFTVATIDPSGHIKTLKRFGTAVTAATISGEAAWLVLGS